MARKYVSNGKPNGGKREGSGRPKGSKNVLAQGETAAVKALGLRVPEGARPEHRAIADEAFETIVSVMRGEVYDPQVAAIRRNAAKDLREEICGPIKQKIELSEDGSFAEALRLARERAQRKVSGGAGPTAEGAASQDASLGPEGVEP